MTDVIHGRLPYTRAFVLRGEVLAWDPLRRELQIGAHRVSVAPSVEVAKLACGAVCRVSGQEDLLKARRIVTHVTVVTAPSLENSAPH
jgi:predicted transcriptional regulator